MRQLELIATVASDDVALIEADLITKARPPNRKEHDRRVVERAFALLDDWFGAHVDEFPPMQLEIAHMLDEAAASMQKLSALLRQSESL